MNEVIDRLQAGYESPLVSAADPVLLGRIHRGAVRRRRRRTTVRVVSASVAVVAAAVIGVAVLGTHGHTPTLPPASQPPSATQRPTLPAGATVGVIDLAVPDADHVFKLTVNEGCVACSTVSQLGPDGTWERLYDFEGGAAYGGRVEPLFGPIEYVDFAADARDGWAWGKTLFSTHDGGRTWSQITDGPGARTDYGHWVHLTADRAWSLHRTDQTGAQLWSTPIGTDDWSTVHAPDLSSATGIESVRKWVVLETSDEGLAGPRLLSSAEGQAWTRLDLPCPGENQPYPGTDEVFVLCPAETGGATVYRSVGLASWEILGHSDLASVNAVLPLWRDHVVLVGAPHDLLLTPTGMQPVDVGLAKGEEIFQGTFGTSGATTYVVTSQHRILVSHDAGATWDELP
jgi:hypothetical protein